MVDPVVLGKVSLGHGLELVAHVALVQVKRVGQHTVLAQLVQDNLVEGLFAKLGAQVTLILNIVVGNSVAIIYYWTHTP